MPRIATFLALLALLGAREETALAETPKREQASAALAGNVRILEASVDDGLPTVGPSDAPVTLEFFLHLGERSSRRAYLLVQELIRRHPKRLRVVYRITEKSPRAPSSAQNFGQEAIAQGRFFQFIEVYFGHFGTSIPTPRDYAKISEAAGMKYQRVTRSMESIEHLDAINANYYHWKRSRVARIPGFRLNGRPLAGIRRIDDLEAQYDAALADAKRLRAQGVPRDQISKTLGDREDQRLYSKERFHNSVDQGGSGETPKGPSAVPMAAVATGAMARGSDSPKVTLTFVCHFQSRDCGNMSRDLDLLHEAYKDEVQIRFRPLYDAAVVTQSKAPLMHQASMCAADQGAFWGFYKLAYEYQPRLNFNFDLSVAVELAEASGLDLDIEAFEACLESGKHLDHLATEIANLRSAGVGHTPALVLDGVAYWGRLGFNDMRLLVESALRPGLLQQLGGR